MSARPPDSCQSRILDLHKGQFGKARWSGRCPGSPSARSRTTARRTRSGLARSRWAIPAARCVVEPWLSPSAAPGRCRPRAGAQSQPTVTARSQAAAHRPFLGADRPGWFERGLARKSWRGHTKMPFVGPRIHRQDPSTPPGDHLLTHSASRSAGHLLDAPVRSTACGQPKGCAWSSCGRAHRGAGAAGPAVRQPRGSESSRSEAS